MVCKTYQLNMTLTNDNEEWHGVPLLYFTQFVLVTNALVNNIRHEQVMHRYRHMYTVSVV